MYYDTFWWELLSCISGMKLKGFAPSSTNSNMIFALGLGWTCVEKSSDLLGTRVDNGRLELQVDLTSTGASLLEFANDLQAFGISNLAKDDVLAIEPRGDDGGDEELRSVAAGNRLAGGDDLKIEAKHTCWDQH